VTWRALLVAAWACVAGGAACYRPDLRDCTVACDPQHGCPGSLACVGGFCTHGGGCPGPEAPVDGPGTDALVEAPGDAPTIPDAADEPAPERDAPPFKPTDLTGLILWLDPVLASTGASGFAWPDRSPAHNGATAPPERSPSLLPASGSLPPTVELSGDGQYLDLPALAVAGPGMAFFVVAEPRPLAAPGQPAVMRFTDFACTEGNLTDGIVFSTTGKQGQDLLFTAFLAKGTPPTPAPTAVQLSKRQLLEAAISSFVEGGTVELYYYTNAMQSGHGATNAFSSASCSSNFIGHSNTAGAPGQSDFRGALDEIVIYDRELFGFERAAVEDYLLRRWQLR